MTRMIRNFDALNSTLLREHALSIAEAGYAAINTETVVRGALTLSEQAFSVGGRTYDLSRFERVRIIGFGKVSCKAVQAIESVLKGHVSDGIAIDIQTGVCDIVDIVTGTHPYPSPQNVSATERIVALSKDSSAKDLVIVVVSGGGSSLLCYPYAECEQGTRLYDDFKRVGASISEVNLVRRHISSVKGGGLAALLYPATVVGLVFSDIADGKAEDVASGPTYFDPTTEADAQAVLDRYGFSGYVLRETPKDPAFFAHVHNVEVVSNVRAIDAMATAASAMKYRVISAGAGLYDDPFALVEKMYRESGPGVAVVGGGEPSIKVVKEGGVGGCCAHTALHALKRVGKDEVFLAFASDGRDNSDFAGAIADSVTVEHARERTLSIEDALARFDSYTFFKQTGDFLMTGPTGSNVSDLFILLNKQET